MVQKDVAPRGARAVFTFDLVIIIMFNRHTAGSSRSQSPAQLSSAWWNGISINENINQSRMGKTWIHGEAFAT